MDYSQRENPHQQMICDHCVDRGCGQDGLPELDPNDQPLSAPCWCDECHDMPDRVYAEYEGAWMGSPHNPANKPKPVAGKTREDSI